jgi:hypothetical protein
MAIGGDAGKARETRGGAPQNVVEQHAGLRTRWRVFFGGAALRVAACGGDGNYAW